VARDFNGSTDRIDYPSAFDTTGQAITISVWAWCDDDTPGAIQYLFNSASSGGVAGTIFYLPSGVSTALTFQRIGTASLVRTSNASQFTAGQWNHFLVTHDGVISTGASSHIYVNGTEVSYILTENGSGETTANSGFQLGGRSSDDARNFDGRLAEPGVWNRVASAGEIAALAKGFPPSDFPYLLKFHDPLIRAVGNRRGGAATLDGTTVIAHPRIIRRVPNLWRPNVAGAAPAEFPWHYYAQQRQMAA